MKPVLEDSPGTTIITEELRMLARVSGAVGALSSDAPGAPDFDAELVGLRDQLAEAKPEDIAAIVEQMTRISAIAQRYGKGKDLPIDPSAPYFAHIRLKEDDRRRDVLIGKRGFIDRERQVHIVDWRNAPVSRIYYRYEEDDDYEEQLGDRVAEGSLELRRNVTIGDGSLKRIACPQVTYVADQDGRWFEADPVQLSALSGGQGKASRPPSLKRGNKSSRLGVTGHPTLRVDKHLPEIAALIDRKQFDLITHPESGLVVLQGGAGTGKTTVALHRVAFLTYQRPKLFRPDKTAVIVPSRAMARYVERVLPSLDVNSVRVVTSAAWFERTRRKLLPQTAKTYADDTPPSVLRLKKHPLMLEALRRHVDEQVADCGCQLFAAIDDERLRTQIQQAWDRFKSKAIVPRLRTLRGWLDQQQLPALERQRTDSVLLRLGRRARDVCTDWTDIFTDREYLGQMAERHFPQEFTGRQIDQACSWCKRQISAMNNEERSALEAEPHEEYVAADGIIETDAKDTGIGLDRADDALLLHLLQLKHGELRTPKTAKQAGRHGSGASGHRVHYEHLVVDEAQDLSAVELKVLLETTAPRYCVTLAGDTAQRVVFDNAFSDWESLLDRLDAPTATNTTLTLGYRSTGEVMSLARSLLGQVATKDGEPLPTRSGSPVELHRFNDQGEAVAMIADSLRSLMLREPLASVALVARYPAQASSYAQALVRAEVPSIRLVRDQDFSFKPGIEVTDISQVKGLEFDYVILLDTTATNYPDTIESRHLLHIGATRAAHQLWLISVGNPSALLPATL